MARLDVFKIAAALLFVIAGVVVYYLPVARSLGQFQFVPVAVGLILGGILFLLAQPGRSFVGFARDSVQEGKKVAWPTRKEAMQMTAVVFVFVAVLALILWLLDTTIAWLFYDVILKRGG